MTLSEYKAKLEEWKKARAVAIPGPWFHDMGNWEIETHDKDNYRQAVCSVKIDNRKKCDGTNNYWSQDYDTPDFIVLAANNWTKLIDAHIKAVEALEFYADKEKRTLEKESLIDGMRFKVWELDDQEMRWRKDKGNKARQTLSKITDGKA